MRVEAMVRELIGVCSSVVHAVRLATVIKLVEAIIRGGRLIPATIGRSLRGSARPKHEIKRVDRLLGNPKMTGDRMFLFLAISHRLLRGAQRPVILVDWTQAGGTHVALVAAVPIDGRALPIYIEVHPLKKLGKPPSKGDFSVGSRPSSRRSAEASSSLTPASRDRSFPPSSNVAGIFWVASEARPRPSLPPARRSRRKSFTPEQRPLPSSWEHSGSS